LASPGLRQIQDFVSAIYSPYATDELLNRYDSYYDDYESRPSKQFNNQYRSFDEAQGLLSEIVKTGGQDHSSSSLTKRSVPHHLEQSGHKMMNQAPLQIN